MINTDEYLEPRKYYDSFLKDHNKEIVESYFDELVKKSGVDIDANKANVNKINAKNVEIHKAEKSLGKSKAVQTLLTLAFIVGCCGAAICLTLGIIMKNMAYMYAIAAVVLALSITALVFSLTKFKKKTKAISDVVDKLKKDRDALINEAQNQLSPLLSLFRENMTIELFNKSIPLIQFDEYLKKDVEDRIVNQFGSPLDNNVNHSNLVVQSGNLNTNPFLIRQYLSHWMADHVYTGTLVITYTRRVSDGQGGYRTVTVTQTLTAHVTRPEPKYGVNTVLEYYSDAASKLNLSRGPAGLVGKSEKEINKIVDKKDKEESKKAEKALKSGGNYTKFANSKFEAYFNCTSRNNELEYRLLFTPLAQTNYIYNNSLSDDYSYYKSGCKNAIMSGHSAGADFSGGVTNYIHYDFEQVKSKFIGYNTGFFYNVYFDFLPLISIPIFHQHQSAPYVEGVKSDLISYYEAESLINSFNPNNFKPEGCDTSVILKVNNINKSSIGFTSYGFHAVAKTDFIPVMGGDGHMHSVPVHYYEYFPVSDVYSVNLINDGSNSLDNNKENVINYKLYRAQAAHK